MVDWLEIAKLGPCKVHIQILFIHSSPSPLPESETGLVCRYCLNNDSFHSSNSLQSEICRTLRIQVGCTHARTWEREMH